MRQGGGIEKYTFELGRRLIKRGHLVRVYTMKHYGLQSNECEGMEIIKIPSIPFKWAEKLSNGFIATLYEVFSNWADIIHYHHVGPGLFAGLPRLFGRCTLVQSHGLEWKRARWSCFGKIVLKYIETFAILVNKNFTAVSKLQCDYFKYKYGIESHYIPPGVTINEHVNANEIIKIGLIPHKYILFASRLVREKGAHYLISAFRSLRTDFNLVIAGDAKNEDIYKNELFKLAKEDSRILFTGNVEGRLLEELFSNAAIYVQPSEIEGLSIALLEAMSYSLPCLVSDIPENLEAIGGCGFFFKNMDANDLSDKLDWVLANPKQGIDIGKKARQLVKQYFDWEMITDKFEAYYYSLIRENNGH